RPGCQRRGSGTIQVLNLGVTSVITPWPRGRVSPYVVAGVAALQTWSSGSGYYRRANGTVGSIMPPNFGTHGDIRAIVGAGLRVRDRSDISVRDRKSTRLNSSHVAISYAVFCLKKKKK